MADYDGPARVPAGRSSVWLGVQRHVPKERPAAYEPQPPAENWAGAYAAIDEAEELGATEALVAKLQNPVGQIREACIAALGRLGGEQATSAVIAALGDDDPWVRKAAATALPQVLPEEKAVTRLVQLLHDDDDLVRARAAQELGDLGHRHALLPLETLLRSEPAGSQPQLAAAQALEKLGAGEIARHNPLASPLGLWVIGVALFATGVAVASSNGMGFAAGALGIAGFFVLLAARFRFARVMREQGFFLAGDSMGGGDVWIGASAGGGGGEFGGLGEGGGGDGGGGGGGG